MVRPNIPFGPPPTLLTAGKAVVAVLLSSGCTARPSPSTGAAPSASSGLPSTGVRASADILASEAAHPSLASSDPAGTSVPPRERPPSSASAEPTQNDARPRLHALSRYVWVWPEPDTSRQWIGFLWFGGSVPLRSSEPRTGVGCERFYAIEPRGFVCVDERKATLDPRHPTLVGLAPYAPRVDSPWIHRYGESRGLARYAELPDDALQRRREADYRDQMDRLERARQGGAIHRLLAGVDLTPAPEAPVVLPVLPRGLREDRATLGNRSTVAYSAETRHGARSWLLTADLMWVPKDRVAVYPKVTFSGVHLTQGNELPIAFFREQDRPRYERTGSASLRQSGQSYPRLSWTRLTGGSIEVDNEKYLEVADGSFVRAQDAVVPAPRTTTPWGAPVGGKDETRRAPRGRQTWIDVSILGGWLVAYEGTHPVFATLISPGHGGMPQPGKEPIETGATPTGRFIITGKFKTATMVAPGDFIHSDVPWAQNFSGPYALHGAYWHDDWGELKSGGCVNVSPIDAKWLFEWTEPEAPAGWHGVRWLPHLEPATTFMVHR